MKVIPSKMIKISFVQRRQQQPSPQARTPRHVSSFLPLVLSTAGVGMTLIAAGCGSGGGTTYSSPPAAASTAATGSSASVGTGRATLRFVWPARAKTKGRLIPEAANSIVIQVLRNVGGVAAVIQSQTVARPSDPPDGGAPVSTIMFQNLPLDTLTAAASAYSTADGSGVALAAGATPLSTVDGQPATFSVTMNSTIDHLVVTPDNVSIGLYQAEFLTATAYDAADEMVLLSPDKLSWQSSDTNVASVDPNGLVTGSGSGTVTITATDTESGQSASSVVTVGSSPNPTPNPTPTPTPTPTPP